MHKIMHIFMSLASCPKTGRGLGEAIYGLIYYARSTQCVAVNCEVPVTLYSVCIRAEKACL